MIKHAYTENFHSRATVLVSECSVSKAYRPIVGLPHPPYVEQVKAIWDTGSQSTVISSSIASKLGLKSMGQVLMNHATGTVLVDTYMINLVLPNRMEIPNLFVIEGNMGAVDILLGMDVITLGDFCITQPNGATMFSYQTPSTHKTDYKQEQN